MNILSYEVSTARGQGQFHDYGNCGWHHEQFSISRGQAIYRWTINTILERAGVDLRLADEGEDCGRLAQTTTYDQSTLASTMATRTDAPTGDRVRHAIALFRRRDADEHTKRSACIALAGILEERRSILKRDLFTKDEGALFEIANRFAVRHQRSDQQGDYDPVFLDWIFWAFLSTIELTDRLIERVQSTAPD